VIQAKARLERVQGVLKRFRQAVLAAACSGELTREWREKKAKKEDVTGKSLLKILLQQRPLRWEKDQADRSGSRRTTYPEPVDPADKESLPDLPDTWLWTSLDALTFKIADGVHKKPQYVDKGIPFVTVRNLTAGPGIDFSRLNYVSREDHLQFADRTNPERGDLLISKDGTLGVVRAIRTDIEFSVFVSVALLKPVSTSLTNYMELALSAPQIQALMAPTGSGLQHLHLRDLKTIPIPLPSFEEQNEIVRQVERLFALADTTERRVQVALARAEKLPQAILAKAFAGELVPTEAALARAEGRSYESAAELLARVKASGSPQPPARGRRKKAPEPAAAAPAPPEPAPRAEPPAKAPPAPKGRKGRVSEAQGKLRGMELPRVHEIIFPVLFYEQK